MKKAVFQVKTVYIDCPYCYEGIESPNGSFLWDEEDFSYLGTSEAVLTCKDCGKESKLPKGDIFKRRAVSVKGEKVD